MIRAILSNHVDDVSLLSHRLEEKPIKQVALAAGERQSFVHIKMSRLCAWPSFMRLQC